MANLLSMLMAGLTGQRQPEDTTVSEIEVSPMPSQAPPAPPPTRNPFTPDYVQAAQDAALMQGQLPRVSGGTDTGLFGFLPKGMQQGRFRDVLGAIGDGLLIGSKADPMYLPRRDARLQGQALIGFGQDPQAAIERLGTTGAPGSMDLVKSLQTEYQRSQDREAQREMTAEYRTQQNRIRADEALRKLGSIVPGVLSRANTPELYASAYDRLAQVTQRIDPELNPTTAWGLPHPDDWTPEMTAWIGTTGGEQIRADTTREGIAQRHQAAEWSHEDRIMAEGGRNQRNAINEAGRNNRANQAETGRNNRHNTPKVGGGGGGSSGGGGPKLHPRNQPNAPTRGPGKVNPPVPGFPQARNMDVDWLKKNNNPQGRAAFEKQFGPGTAKRYLGN